MKTFTERIIRCHEKKGRKIDLAWAISCWVGGTAKALNSYDMFFILIAQILVFGMSSGPTFSRPNPQFPHFFVRYINWFSNLPENLGWWITVLCHLCRWVLDSHTVTRTLAYERKLFLEVLRAYYFSLVGKDIADILDLPPPPSMPVANKRFRFGFPNLNM